MNLVCPHNKKIKVEKKFGVVSYLHEDGTACDLLNNFSVSINKIADVMVKNSKIDLLLSDKKVYVLNDSKFVVDYFVKVICQCNCDEIVYITLYLLIKKRIPLINKLIKVIGSDFITVLKNSHIVDLCYTLGIQSQLEIPMKKVQRINLNIIDDKLYQSVKDSMYKSIDEITTIVDKINRRYN